MTVITNFNAISQKANPVLADAYGNNVAFQCSECSGPVLATMLPNQRGTSVAKPAVCRKCSAGFWIEIDTEESRLVVHKVENFVPIRLRLGKAPNLTACQNLASWSVIAAILNAYGEADYVDLANSVRQHDHKSGGRAFIDYCVKNNWLTQA